MARVTTGVKAVGSTFQKKTNVSPIRLTIEHNGVIFEPPIKDEVTIEWERTGTPGKLTFTTIKVNDPGMSFLEGDRVIFYYNNKAVLLGMVYNFVPFMILQINTSLCKMDKSLLEASAELGANPFLTFWKVVFPLSLPGVISGISLVFLPAVSSFFIPKLLGGGQYFLIGNVIENQFITVGEWNFGSAISMIMAVIMMLSMYAVRHIEERNSGKRKEKKA